MVLHLLELAFLFILKSINRMKICIVDRNDFFFTPLFTVVGCPFIKARSGAAPRRVQQMVPVYPAAGHMWVEKLCKAAECGMYKGYSIELGACSSGGSDRQTLVAGGKDFLGIRRD